MDPRSLAPPKNSQEKAQLQDEVVQDANGIANYIWPLLHPTKLLADLLASGFRLLRPAAPRLIPFAIFSLTLPVIFVLSVIAGILVWRNVAVGWETDFYLQYGDGRSPFAEVELQNLVAQQPYDISAHLVVPAVEANYALGNFMATLTIVAPSNKTMAHIRRPALVLPPSSSHLSFLYSKPGTVDLHIPLLYSFEADTTRATARIELGRIDQWRSLGNGAGRELSVSSASLRGLVVHEGFRGIITRFPTISAIAASGIFFFIGFVILASCLLPALQWHFPEDETPEKGAAEKTVRSSRRRFQFEVDSRSARRPKTPRRSQSETSHRSFKGEEIVADIPSATFGTTTPLRRRRSRTSQEQSDSDG